MSLQNINHFHFSTYKSHKHVSLHKADMNSINYLVAMLLSIAPQLLLGYINRKRTLRLFSDKSNQSARTSKYMNIAVIMLKLQSIKTEREYFWKKMPRVSKNVINEQIVLPYFARKSNTCVLHRECITSTPFCRLSRTILP